eukprot:SAG22_NODE_387_length_11302_cov_333.169597_2_plen_760_part_00
MEPEPEPVDESRGISVVMFGGAAASASGGGAPTEIGEAMAAGSHTGEGRDAQPRAQPKAGQAPNARHRPAATQELGEEEDSDVARMYQQQANMQALSDELSLEEKGQSAQTEGQGEVQTQEPHARTSPTAATMVAEAGIAPAGAQPQVADVADEAVLPANGCHVQQLQTKETYIDDYPRRGCPFASAHSTIGQNALMAHHGNASHSPHLYGDDAGSDNAEARVEEARLFIQQFYDECKGWDASHPDVSSRFEDIRLQIAAGGDYLQTFEELEFGVRLAWRNAPRCINRIQWKNLQLLDCRMAKTPDEVFECCIDHLRAAYYGGVITSTISVFPQKPPGSRGTRIWNAQLMSFAGYAVDLDGSEKAHLSGPEHDILGDPASLQFTEVCEALGWTPPRNKSPYDLLPIVIECTGYPVAMFELPADIVTIVQITHPRHPELTSVDMRWYHIPALSDFAVDIGGVVYSCAPFNGWYMETEICRDLLDVQRYNFTDTIIKALDIDDDSSSFAYDTVQLIVNQAIMSSFGRLNISIVGHDVCSQGFMKFFRNEMAVRKRCPGDWVWLVPPAGGSMSPVFHQEMLNYQLKPFYCLQPHVWENGNLPGLRDARGYHEMAKALLGINEGVGIIKPTHAPTFSGVISKLAEQLAKETVREVHQPGHILMSAGERGDSVYFILSGQLSVRLGLDSTKSVALLGPGDLVGEAAVVTCRHWRTAKCVRGCGNQPLSTSPEVNRAVFPLHRKETWSRSFLQSFPVRSVPFCRE